MGVLLFFIAVLMLVIGYYITNQQLITPTVISSLVVAITSLVGYLFEDYWNVSLRFETVSVIVGGLFFILIGNYGGMKLGDYIHCKEFQISKKYYIKNSFLFIYALFMVYLLYQYYININYFIISLSDTYIEATDVLQKVRMAKLDNEFDEPIGVKLATSVNNCFFIVACYCIVYNSVFFKLEKEDIKLLIPIITYTITSVLNSSRIDFLGPFFYLISISVVMMSFKHKSGYVLKKFFVNGGIASVLFLSWFSLLRYFRGGEFNVFDHLARYISGGMYCFDKYYAGDVNPYLYSKDFGAHLFIPFYKGVEYLDIYTDITGRVSSTTFVDISNFQCNIFSAFAPMVEDVGVLGCWIILLIVSFLMGGAQQYIVKQKIMGLKLIMFAETMSIFYMICVAEQLFSAHLVLSRLAHFVLVYIFLLIVEKWRMGEGRKEC